MILLHNPNNKNNFLKLSSPRSLLEKKSIMMHTSSVGLLSNIQPIMEEKEHKEVDQETNFM